MSFTQEVKHLHSISADISRLSSLLTPQVISSIQRLNSIDFPNINKLTTSVTTIQNASLDIKNVLNGLDSINNVLKIQNQVQHVSDIRDSVGLVAGSIDKIKKVADYTTTFGGVLAMQPMIEDVLALSEKMDTVIDLSETLDNMISVEARLDEKLDDVRRFATGALEASAEAKTALFKIKATEANVEKILTQNQHTLRTIEEFTVTAKHIESKDEVKSKYNKNTNTLEVLVPRGKIGPRGHHIGPEGKPGKNGASFKPSYMGSIVERNRYSNHAPGTSFLSLDEIPTMIYFRKSNTIGDWTEGQPFGVSNGGYNDEDEGIDIVNGINIDELTSHIIRNMERR